MIDEAEPHSLVYTSKNLAGQALSVFGHLTAPIDLTLRGVVFTWFGGENSNYQVLASDPDLSAIAAGDVVTEFQLIAYTGEQIQDISIPGNFVPRGYRTEFQNLAFPLARGQTLYWGGQVADQLIQLFFS